MNCQVSKIFEENYALECENGEYLVTINTTPRINKKGEVRCEAYFFEKGNNNWVCKVSAPFVFLVSELKNRNVSAKHYLLNLLREEIQIKTKMDMTKPIDKILQL